MGKQEGFLEGQRVRLTPRTQYSVCQTGQKRKNTEEGEVASKKPKGGTRPIVMMVLKRERQNHRVQVLLDTGCSIPLINRKTVVRLGIPLLRHDSAIPIENFTGEAVKGAGQYYTKPLTLQHQRHTIRESFEVSPMEEGTDIFLPFWWIAEHPPQETWKDPEIRFDSAQCLEKCTVYEQADFSLTWDDTVYTDPKARIVGYVTTGQNKPRIPAEFRQYLDVMGKEMANVLPKHGPYDCKIDLKEGSTAPWGPIYPLSETELQTFWEWLMEMEKTGKIRRYMSPVGSPILFVPKPNSRGLRLCVDDRALTKITIPNRYPLPLMQELQDRVQGSRWFTKLDLKNGFNLIRIKEGDEWKTAFQTRYGLYQL